MSAYNIAKENRLTTIRKEVALSSKNCRTKDTSKISLQPKLVVTLPLPRERMWRLRVSTFQKEAILGSDTKTARGDANGRLVERGSRIGARNDVRGISGGNNGSDKRRKAAAAALRTPKILRGGLRNVSGGANNKDKGSSANANNSAGESTRNRENNKKREAAAMVPTRKIPRGGSRNASNGANNKDKDSSPNANNNAGESSRNRENNKKRQTPKGGSRNANNGADNKDKNSSHNANSSARENSRNTDNNKKRQTPRGGLRNASNGASNKDKHNSHNANNSARENSSNSESKLKGNSKNANSIANRKNKRWKGNNNVRYAQARFQEDNGNFWVLQKFSQKHQLLKGINEYRVALIEANPNTFVLPHHCDAEKIYIVTNGKGTITFVTHKDKESFNVVRGVVVRIPAGSTVYLVNQDNKEKLTIAVLHRPVNNPGEFEEFFPAGQEHPQSYYRSFGHEILEAVFNTRSEQLEKLFHGHGRQSQQGMFREASQEQIKSLSKGATTPKEKEAEFAFNLLAQKPKYSNQNGKFYEACPRDFELLRQADASVVGFEINQGSIFVPHYNSHSSFVILITEGNGYVEMVCPHLSSSREEEEEESTSGEYRRVRVQLSPGDVFVVPAGHPVTYVASKKQNLRALAFGLYHQNNTRIFVAGKNNMVRQMDSAAKEISFGVPAKLVDEVFNNPEESYFVSLQGQRQRQRGSEDSRGNPISSILDFARLF
ncbi:hypothetical protein V6N13_013507 [Hibiscus sabdariffa]